LRAGFTATEEVRPRIDRLMRDAYRRALIEAEASRAPEPPNPFTHGDAAFTEWLLSPAWPESQLSRYLAAGHAARADLRAAFPRIPGPDEPALLGWAASKHGGTLPAGLPTGVLTG